MNFIVNFMELMIELQFAHFAHFMGMGCTVLLFKISSIKLILKLKLFKIQFFFDINFINRICEVYGLAIIHKRI
jgi:hypothetical protein